MAGADVLPHPFVRPPWSGGVPLVSPVELRKLIAANEPLVLVDVRVPEERALARLAADRALPLSELPGRAAELAKDAPIVCYDQFGAQARRAAEYLQRRGYARAAALEGGIDEYARIIDPSIPRYTLGDDPLFFRQIPRYDSGCLAYLVGDPTTHRAAVIDPGRDIAPYLELLREGGWALEAIVETHTHADHLAGHAALHERTGAPIWLSRRSPAEYPHQRVSHGEAIRFGDEEIGILETPGHTADHLTLRLGDRLFTGDTLLIGGCGRTDLGDGDPHRLFESLHDRLLRLPDDTEVFPAHFGSRHALVDRYSSSVGFERATNEALLQRTEEEFVRYMTEGWPAKPTNFDQIVRTNLTE